MAQDFRLGKGWLIAAVLAAGVGLGAAWWIAQPDRSLDPYERLAAQIGCQCGTCPLRPIATCGCGFADSMLDELRGLVASGMGDEQIMSTFVSRYNESIRISPQRGGLALAAWAVPMMLLSVGGVLLTGLVVRWTSAPAAADREVPATEPITPTTAADDDTERLRALVERELEGLED